MHRNIWEIAWYCFIGLSGIQLFYYLFFFSRLAFYPMGKLEESQQASEDLSVIICAKDEETNLRRNLPVVLQQRYQDDQLHPKFEVIVVNDNSEDDSTHYLRSIQPGYPHFRSIELKQEAKGIPGKKYPLTVGIKGARFDKLVLTDADCRPAGVHWLQKMSLGFVPGKDIVLGYGAYERKPGLLNKVIRFETYFSALQYLSFALAKLPYMGVGRNLAYSKDLFFHHKGFLAHQGIPSGDDDLFINKAATGRNTAVIIHPEAITYSEPKTCWSAWMRQKSRHLSTGRYYRPIHKFLLGLFSLSLSLYLPFLVLALFYRPFFVLTLGIIGARLLIQMVVHYLSLRKLGESDLFGWSLILECLMPLYYIAFTPSLFRKPKMRWN